MPPTQSNESLHERAAVLGARVDALRGEALALDLTRGKPSAAQLDLAAAGLEQALGGDFRCEDGSDARNYGHLAGIPEMRRLCARYLGVAPEEALAAGNSSLQLMYQYVLWALHFGPDGETPWKRAGTVKFLCPVPGYDRHFALCEELGIEMIPVPMTGRGPDLDAVEALLEADRSIRGLWVVPKYSNPTGVSCDDATVERIARLGRIAPPGFRVLWDNAYAVHDLRDDAPELANVMEAARAAGTVDTVVQFGSTSKISLAGAGIAFMGASPSNLRAYLARMELMTIGPDKLNQLRHVRFFGDLDGIRAHMRRHAELLRPKFDCVLRHLEDALGAGGLGTWNAPAGGYFVSFEAPPGTASRIVALAGELGVRLTPAGAAFPHGHDPEDSHIRLAPTFPPLPELDKAMEVFVTCVELIALRVRLGANDRP